jgi:dihydrofolate synthase/folylpolyglutamate synthase
LELLYRRSPHVMKLDLAPVRALLGQMGDPHRAYPCIHVAGTNGKGSVSAMLAAVLQRAGLRTGLYTSPHLVRFNERIRIDGAPITDADLESLVVDIDARAKSLDQRDVTFFEFATAIAFEYFKRKAVDVAVVETGMGGRLDATNVVDPLVAVITSIGFDHTQHLGDTLEAIAAEKAGIIKPKRPVVCGALPDEARSVVERIAAERGANLAYAADEVSVRRIKQSLDGQRVKIETQDGASKPINLPLLGYHQLANCAVVAAVIECLAKTSKDWNFSPENFQGLENTDWPARFQVLQPDPPVILDGAHNPEAARALAATYREVLKKKPAALVAGFLSDKDAAGFLAEVKHLVRKCWIVQPACDRAMKQRDALAMAAAAGLKPEAAVLEDAVGAAKSWAAEEGGAVIITGSLYIAGEVLAIR